MLAVAYRILMANLKREEGQTMAEYGIILAVVAVAVAGTLVFLTQGIQGTINDVTGAL